jgi:hypothetical protein
LLNFCNVAQKPSLQGFGRHRSLRGSHVDDSVSE